ncbi:MAG: D-alanyl-D-alanine carboxypeptidase [Clostridia bacterium]|nr:D-alanyl-D-alanine carboxypeptidase [Clostridia bacterium]
MLKKTFIIITVLLTVSCTGVGVSALSADEISAVSAVLYYPDGDEVLFEKNSRESRSMASTTKMMTSLLALEKCTPHLETRITGGMVNVEGTSSGLRENDIITLRDLVYCMMLESGNDAANAVALTLSDSFESFALLMNKRAEEIGMKDTSFVTPSGLDADDHYTTAYDMALLAAECIRNREFVHISTQKKHTVYFGESEKTVTLYNHNKLLQSYEGCTGIKTGFTKKSGRCLVSSAERNGVTLVAVTLYASDDWNDHEKMLDYGFERIKNLKADTSFPICSVCVTGGTENSVGIESDELTLHVTDDSKNIERKIYLNKFLYAPVAKGEIIGFAEYVQGEKIIGRTLLRADRTIEKKREEKFSDRLKSLVDRW